MKLAHGYQQENYIMAKMTAKAEPTAPAMAEAAIQQDLFLCAPGRWPVKDDLASMAIPLFSLQKQRDTRIRTYKRGNASVKVIPSAVGSATVFDKDLLIYVVSQMVAAHNEAREISRTVQINTIDFLNATERGDGRESFEHVIGMLRRLKGTTIETNIPTGDVVQTKGFSLIDSYEILNSKSRKAKIQSEDGKLSIVEVERPLTFAITVSEWFFNAIASFEVLTLDQSYFRLEKPYERRLYELARKHCGGQVFWSIGLDLLAEKLGQPPGELFRIRALVRESILGKRLPEYHVALNTATSPHQAVFYTRDSARLTAELARTKKFDWFHELQRHDNSDTWEGKKADKPDIADV
jgi:plasmid replication initiation protein